jgi:hypothetical protein
MAALGTKFSNFRSGHYQHPIMLLITRRLATGLFFVPIGGIRFAGAASDATASITFILVNDIYLMADELMLDGQRRGGFGSRLWLRLSAPRQT